MNKKRKDISAIIFDLDGVLWDSSHAHIKAFIKAFNEINLQLPVDFYELIAGNKTTYSISYLLKKYFPKSLNDENIKLLSKQKQKYSQKYLKLIKADQYADYVLNKLRARGYILALATSASEETLNIFLNLIKNRYFFKSIICGDNVTNGKPDPEIYLLTAKKLSINPCQIVVIEDSISGLQAAINANMKVISYRNQKFQSQHQIGHCDLLKEILNIL